MLAHDPFDLIVFSHLRWDFVFQRPQHLLTRFANLTRVFFVEEPFCKGRDIPSFEFQSRENGVIRVIPHLPEGLSETRIETLMEKLTSRLLDEQKISNFALWYYTPMAIPFTQKLKPRAVIYDCMDELSLFKGAHPKLLEYEGRLLALADVVFTGGQSLYEYKKESHPNVYPFPSSIDFSHFEQARNMLPDPPDQRGIRGLRLGFYGVIDERMDLELLEGLAKERPNWQIIILGPVVKISHDALPKLPNIHYLGQKSYLELPAYISGWDVALMPFARNESTRYISPTKTPEYLAAGKPVVSTPIRDVVRPYGEQKLVHIAETPAEFVEAIEAALRQSRSSLWKQQVDEFLSQTSWDITWEGMAELVKLAVSGTQTAQAKSARAN